MLASWSSSFQEFVLTLNTLKGNEFIYNTRSSLKVSNQRFDTIKIPPEWALFKKFEFECEWLKKKKVAVSSPVQVEKGIYAFYSERSRHDEDLSTLI